jgi:exonuclease SbcD
MHRLMQASDLHYCQRHLEHVDKAFAFAVNDAIARKAELAVLSGDSFDSAINVHEPAVAAFLGRVKTLADAMPVIVLAGTQSHDRPGALNVLRTLGGNHEVFVGDQICQVAWTDSGWVRSPGHAFTGALPHGSKVLFSILPSINRGVIAAAVGAENVAEKASEAIYDLCRGWAVTNLSARQNGIGTVMITHGTVNGAMTECAHALVSIDHEFTAGTLFAAETAAVMIGHIHAHNSWEHGGRRIAYPGSITRLIHGHAADTGYLMWDVQADKSSFEFIKTPAKRLLELTFPGPPDMDELRRAAADAAGSYTRIRFSVDEESRHQVDRKAIEAIFASAAELKIEARVLPVQRTRAAGIGQALTLADRLRHWCDLTQSEPAPLLERLHAIETGDVADIIKEMP